MPFEIQADKLFDNLTMPAAAEDCRILVGYLWREAKDEWRLYRSIELAEYIALTKAEIQGQYVKDERSLVWVNRDLKLRIFRSPRVDEHTDDAIGFAQGPIARRAPTGVSPAAGWAYQDEGDAEPPWTFGPDCHLSRGTSKCC